MSIGGIASEVLKQGIERIERLEEEKKGIADDIKGVYSHLKGSGFDAKIIRLIVSRRKKSAQEREEEDQLVELYEAAVEAGFARSPSPRSGTS